ncbi:MAG: hypothetical protein EA412_02775 [Chitinophagaceae bacterium]|nr:MAG: hypothetical protein EA412_02775 [Chitinophagaceae bacterium]
MEDKNINVGNVILKVLDLLILKIFTLPYKIYVNALVSLSNTGSEDSEESNLSSDFPLYVWFVSVFNALIVISYPLGIIIAIVALINTKAIIAFVGTLIFVYFYPLILGLFRELLQITLKTLLYLKIISKK